MRRIAAPIHATGPFGPPDLAARLARLRRLALIARFARPSRLVQFASLARPRFARLAVLLGACCLAPEAFATPDLVVERVDASAVQRECSTSQVSGTVSVTIRNDGLTPVQSSLRLLLFADANASGAYEVAFDSVLAEVAVAPLQGSSRATIPVTIGGELPFAGAPIHAFIDSRNTVIEVSEDNNVTSSAAPSTAPPCQGAGGPFQEPTNEKILGWDRPLTGTVLVAHLTDDNGDGSYDDRDVPTLLLDGEGILAVQADGTVIAGLLTWSDHSCNVGASKQRLSAVPG